MLDQNGVARVQTVAAADFTRDGFDTVGDAEAAGVGYFRDEGDGGVVRCGHALSRPKQAQVAAADSLPAAVSQRRLVAQG